MKRNIVGIALIVLALAVWLGLPKYRAHKEKKFAAQAQAAMVKNEYRQALLSAQQVLSLNSNNLVAARVMADLADLSRSPYAMIWRRRVAEIEPTLSNRIVFASCALRYEQPPFPIAAQTVKGLSEIAQKDVAFHLVAAQLALKQNRFADGEKHLEESIRLEPANDLHRLNLAIVRLESRDTNKNISARAHAELERMQSSPAWGAQAQRALMVHHSGRQQFADAERYSTALLKGTNSMFADKLEHLRILHGGRSPQFSNFLISLQRNSATNVLAATDLVNHLSQLGMATNAIAWVKSLPESVQKEPPLPTALASTYFSIGHWRELEELLRTQQWKEQEFARKALLSYAVRQQKATDVADVHWRDAVQLASARPETLGALAQMASTWGWTNETEALLWRAAKDFPKERWPIDGLESGYVRMRDASKLYALNTFALERHPTNSFAQNNWAVLSFLLQTNMAKAHQLARQVYERDTNNFGFVSTYAYSLHLQGKPAEALKVIETLKPAALDDPSVAGYYGVILAANGQTEKARRYWEKAEAGPILPEELKIISEARKKL